MAHRPPIVVVMGHIDHGKSKLLDYIRTSNVVEHEAGNITQHIGAYEVTHEGKKITFLDTPGHAAFSKIRARGASVADIAILVVAADEGPKPQTLEGWEVATDAKIPVIVAINKIDLPNANPEGMRAQLAEVGILVEGYGGTVPSVHISAKTGEGVAALLETVLLVAELEELAADPSAPASGTVIESHIDRKRGIAATLVVQGGTLRAGEYVAAGGAIAPVRIVEDQGGTPIREATVSAPVRIVGWTAVPQVGSPFHAVPDKKSAGAQVATQISASARTNIPQHEKPITIALVIKADVSGSLEAVEHELNSLKADDVAIQLLHTGIGVVSEGDVQKTRDTLGALVIGFHVPVDSVANDLAERIGTDIHVFNIIYEITKFLEGEITRRRSALETENITGSAEILKTFSRTARKQVVGGAVLSGRIAAKKEIAIKRRGNEIGRGRITELQEKKRGVSEVVEGNQFGAMIETKIEIAPKDTIEIVERKAT